MCSEELYNEEPTPIGTEPEPQRALKRSPETLTQLIFLGMKIPTHFGYRKCVGGFIICEGPLAN
jgi:hypothetical protein